MEIATGRRKWKWTFACCGAALLMFAVVSWISFQHESATIDEPLHAIGAYRHVFYHDYRVNPEDPPLWNYLCMLPHSRDELRDPTPPQFYKWITENIGHGFQITTHMLYMTAGNAGAEFINASRNAMLLAGVALGAVLAVWAYRIAGSAAAVAAVALYSLDPNFLAHAPLLKNDVSLSLALLAAAWSLCAMGRRLTAVNLIVGLLVVSAAPLIKFSGALVVVIAFALLLIRALLPTPWPMFRYELRTRWQRLAAATVLSFAITATCVLGIWACYGFRFDPTPMPGVRINADQSIVALKQNVYRLANGRWPTFPEVAALPVPLPGRLEQFAERHRLLPQAWLFGMLFTYESTLVRGSFLLGEHYELGHWYYFPAVFIFKTPLATLAAVLMGFGSLLLWRRRPPLDGNRAVSRWMLICIGVPLTIYTLSALTTHLNLGVRHLLPMYPLAFLLLALRFASLLRRFPRATGAIGAALLLALGGETLLACPHYISFFNAVARPHRLSLLSDSNFDWCQDLPYVADWQQAHPTTPLYLGYWGSADPEYYHIRYNNMPGGFVLGPDPKWPPTEPTAAVAVAATLLQGVNCDPKLFPMCAELRAHRPREILGDSIYLYDWPLK